MTQLENRLGYVDTAQSNVNELIGDAVSSCFGVAGLANKWQPSLFGLLPWRQFMGPGVRVSKDGQGLMVDLHVLVRQELNLSATVRSIHNKVRYTVENATGMEVKRVNVFVDGMI